MAQGVGEQQQIDRQQVRQMRRLMSETGDRAVEHRFGEEAKASPEYKEAQRQQDRAKRRAKEQRERVASEGQAKAGSATRRASPKAEGRSEERAKPSERERLMKNRKMAQEREKEPLSR